MTDTHQKMMSILYPYFEEEITKLESENLRFAHYTSADAAMKIIKNKEVWLRNTQCMNDFLEIDHGIECMVEAFHDKTQGEYFRSVLEKIFPGIMKEFTDIFDSWLSDFRTSTFIASVSEHPDKEDSLGRLSMWRAYGGDHSVALVLNRAAFMSPTDIFHAYTHPVSYQDSSGFVNEFKTLADRIKSESLFVEQAGKNKLIAYLFEFFKTCACCLKHPGFSEEREWRVIYNPQLKKSDYVPVAVESINGIPQEIHKIPLKDFPEHGFTGATIPEFINRIIIGPNDHQTVLQNAFINLLTEAGVQNPAQKVHCTNIPLR